MKSSFNKKKKREKKENGYNEGNYNKSITRLFSHLVLVLFVSQYYTPLLVLWLIFASLVSHSHVAIINLLIFDLSLPRPSPTNIQSIIVFNYQP